jgi:hypothetical protein
MAPLNLSNVGFLVFSAVKRECADYTGKGFAKRLGVPESTVCRWGKPCSDADSLPMPAWAVDALADFTGRPDVVFGPQLARHGWRAVADVEADAPAVARVAASAELSAKVAALTVSVLAAEADGQIDARERRALDAELDAIAQKVAALRAGLRVAR